MIALTMSYRMIDGAFLQVINIICNVDKRALIEQSWLTVCWLEVVVRVTYVSHSSIRRVRAINKYKTHGLGNGWGY